MKGRVAVSFVTLDAGADAPLFADTAAELPSRRRDVVDGVDRLKKDGVGEADLGDPETADDVGPATVVRLLEGSALVRAEATLHGPVCEKKMFSPIVTVFISCRFF